MFTRKTFTCSAAAALLLGSSVALAAPPSSGPPPEPGVDLNSDYQAPLQQGFIEALDFADNTLQIDGLTYQLAPGIRVEIGGSWGAFTMLKVGMAVEFDYHSESSAERRILFLREVPAREIEQT